jgi:methionyl-tRNA formyltransferase
MTAERRSGETATPSPIRTVFLGTPAFAVPTLRALAKSPRFDVALVVTQPDRPAGRGRRLAPSPVKALATDLGLEVFQPARLREPGARERLEEARPDLFVLAAYGQLLRPAVLAVPRHGCLNVHPSLLPRHRGPAPVAATILAGDAEAGVTIMLTDAGMDTGPILAQRRVPLTGRETTASLTAALAELGAALLVETAPRWVRGEIGPQPQDEALATGRDQPMNWRGRCAR